MFFPLALITILAAASTAFAALSINGPSPDRWWVQNTSNVITWDYANGDPNPVDITVTNNNSAVLNGVFSIARNVDISNGFFTVTNVTLIVGSGYVVNFINGTNQSQIFSSSGQFEVKRPGSDAAPQPSPTALPSSSGSSSSSSSSSSAVITHFPSQGTSGAIRAVQFNLPLMPIVLSAGMALLGAVVTLY